MINTNCFNKAYIIVHALEKETEVVAQVVVVHRS